MSLKKLVCVVGSDDSIIGNYITTAVTKRPGFDYLTEKKIMLHRNGPISSIFFDELPLTANGTKENYQRIIFSRNASFGVWNSDVVHLCLCFRAQIPSTLAIIRNEMNTEITNSKDAWGRKGEGLERKRKTNKNIQHVHRKRTDVNKKYHDIIFKKHLTEHKIS